MVRSTKMQNTWKETTTPPQDMHTDAVAGAGVGAGTVVCSCCEEPVGRSAATGTFTAFCQCPSPTCKTVACKDCVYQHMINTYHSTLQCTLCSHEWDRYLLARHLGIEFAAKVFDAWYDARLVQYETDRLLPITAQHLMHKKRRRLLQQQLATLQITARNLRQQITLQRIVRSRRTPVPKVLAALPVDAIVAKTTADTSKLYELEKEYKTVRHVCKQLRLQLKYEQSPFFTRQPPRHCPAANCRGILTAALGCTLCGAKVCPQCDERTDNNTTQEAGAVATTHVCDPDAVRSVQCKRTHTTACPDCGTHIGRAIGCNVMFCTMPGCHAMFDFDTGKKLAPVINNRFLPENPEYADHLAQGKLPSLQLLTNLGLLPPGRINNTASLNSDEHEAEASACAELQQQLADLVFQQYKEHAVICSALGSDRFHLHLRKERLRGKISDETFASRVCMRQARGQQSRTIMLVLHELLAELWYHRTFTLVHDIPLENMVERTNVRLRLFAHSYRDSIYALPALPQFVCTCNDSPVTPLMPNKRTAWKVSFLLDV